MIYYFSATGNSKHVANRLAESLNERVTPVPDVPGKPVTVESRMILVYPNYCGGVPSVIRGFLEENTFIENPPVSVLETGGFSYPYGANNMNLRKAASLSVHDLQMVFGYNSPQALYKPQNGCVMYLRGWRQWRWTERRKYDNLTKTGFRED